MNELKLNIELREAQKNASRKLKRKGLVPATAYGPKIQNLCFSLRENDAKKYSHSSFDNKILTLQSSDKKINGLKVLKKQITYHRLNRNPIHFDFLVLDMSRKIRVTVEIKFLGKAKGVKEEGGVLNILRRNVEVECLAGEIPPHFELNVSHLNLNESCHVSDLKISGKIQGEIRLITRPHEPLCLISKAQEEEEVQPAAAAAEAASAEEGAAPAESAPAAQGDPAASKEKASSDSQKKDEGKAKK